MLNASSHRERVAARRLVRSDALSPALALQRVLQAVAGAVLLVDFIDARLRARENDVQRQALRRNAARARHVAKSLAEAADPAAWHAWFDGSAMPNPGRLGLGALVQAPDGRRCACSVHGGTGNSNDAEYLALILALQQALALQPHALIVHGDSRIVIDDVLGRQPPVAALLAHRSQARALLAQFPEVRLVWIPRARNGAADALARAALLSVTEGCSTGVSMKISTPNV